MDSILKYFTTVAQLAVQTQIENFLSKKLCEDDNLCKVIRKYHGSFSNQLAIQDLVDDKQELYFKEIKEEIKDDKANRCKVCEVDVSKNDVSKNDDDRERCKYCNQYFHKSCIKRDNNNIKRKLCPNCSKPFTIEQECYNIFIHEKILREFRDVIMTENDYNNTFTRLLATLPNMGMMSLSNTVASTVNNAASTMKNAAVSSIQNTLFPKGGRTRRKRKRRNITSTKKPSNGNRRKSNNKKQKLKKKKAMKTRKQYPLILVGGGGTNDDEEKTVQDAVIIAHNVMNRNNMNLKQTQPNDLTYLKKQKTGDNDDEEKTVQDAVIIAHNVMNRKNPFYKNMPLTEYVLDRPNRLKPILKQTPTTNLTNLKKQKGYLKEELNSVAGKFNKKFKEARTQMKNDGTITHQLFNEPKSNNDQSPDNQSPDKTGSSGCCQQTPYNDFVKLISLIFNMASIFIKDFFAAGQEDGQTNDILDKIMEILVSSFKITLPDALGTSFSRHMDKLYQSKQNKTAIAKYIKEKTIDRITETYDAPSIKGLRKTVTSIKAM